IAFAQSDHGSQVLKEGKELAKAPHPAAVKRLVTRLPLTPPVLPCGNVPGVGPTFVTDLQQVSALWASKRGSGLARLLSTRRAGQTGHVRCKLALQLLMHDCLFLKFRRQIETSPRLLKTRQKAKSPPPGVLAVGFCF